MLCWKWHEIQVNDKRVHVKLRCCKPLDFLYIWYFHRKYTEVVTRKYLTPLLIYISGMWKEETLKGWNLTYALICYVSTWYVTFQGQQDVTWRRPGSVTDQMARRASSLEDKEAAPYVTMATWLIHLYLAWGCNIHVYVSASLFPLVFMSPVYHPWVSCSEDSLWEP